MKVEHQVFHQLMMKDVEQTKKNIFHCKTNETQILLDKLMARKIDFVVECVMLNKV